MKKLIIGTLLTAASNVFAMGSGSVAILPNECGTTPEHYDYNRSSPPISGIFTDYAAKGREEYRDIYERWEIVNSCPFYESIRAEVNEWMTQAEGHYHTASYHSNNDFKKFGANCLAVIDSKIYSMGRDLYYSIHEEPEDGMVSNEFLGEIENNMSYIFDFGDVCDAPESDEPEINLEDTVVINPEIIDVLIPGEDDGDDGSGDDETDGSDDQEETPETGIKDKVVTCPLKAKFRATTPVIGMELVTNNASFSRVRSVPTVNGFIYTCIYKRNGVQGVGLYRLRSQVECEVQNNVITCEQ